MPAAVTSTALSSADTCKQHAADCDRRATEATDENMRQHYLDLARQWRQMADELERLGRLSAKSE
jgi:hypothetical protein